MEEKPLIIADAIQIEETLFFRHAIARSFVSSNYKSLEYSTFLQRCSTRIGRFLRRFESNILLCNTCTVYYDHPTV